MDIQIVTDDVPALGLWVSRNHRLHMCQEIGLCPRGSTCGGQNLSGDDMAAEDERPGSMTDIFEFAPLDFAWSQGQSRMLALQGLHPGQLVGTDRLFALRGQTGCLLIQGTDRFHCFVPMFIDRRGQPVADQMRLEIPIFPSRAACRGEICLMMPRAITSSAISRPVQWLIGRSFGCSQAIAIIWQVCSAVICEGRPERGTSSRRSLTDTSSSATACQPIQRMRQQRTVSTLIPRSRAIWLLFFPASASKMIRPMPRQLLGSAVPTHQQLQFVSLDIVQGQCFRFGASHWLGPLSFSLEVPVYYRSISASMY